jgi:hypothetical protein
MKITWKMKKRDGREWRMMRRAEIQGQTIREILTAASGSDTVAKFDLPTIGTCYFCGTEGLKVLMLTKGKAVTCESGIRLIDSVHKGLLDIIAENYLGDPPAEQLNLSP